MNGLDQKVIQEILSRGNLFEVGGCVRDSLLGMRAAEKDHDYLVTGIAFEDLVDLLKRHGHADLVGKSFGVIKFAPRREEEGPPPTFDLALPRREFSTGAGHRDFQVDFDHSLSVEDDLARRDFTINAIARDLRNNTLIDPFDGQGDLKRGVIRMLAPDTFRDDPLRMLRAIQFAARFEFNIEPQTFMAISANANLIGTVTSERIQEELNKLLTKAKKPSRGFMLMRETGLLTHILPELEAGVGVEQPGGYHAYDVFIHSVLTVDHLPPRLHLRLAGLLHDIAKPMCKEVQADRARFYGHDARGARMAEELLTRLRYSRQIIAAVMVLIEKHMFTAEVTDKGMRRLIRKTGEDLIFDLLDLRRGDVMAQGMGNSTPEIDELESRIRAELEKKVPLGLAQLAVNGHDIMSEFGLPPSKVVGEILDYLLELVLDNPDDNRKEFLLEKARGYLQEKELE